MIKTHAEGSSSADTSDTACRDSLAGLRIEGVPTFDLNKIEFLEKLGEGNYNKL